MDLKLFPGLLLLNPTPGKLAFIINSTDPAAKKAAASIAFRLGTYNPVLTNDLTVQTSDQVLKENLAGRDTILIGLPKNLAQMAEWKAALPVAFEAGTNKISDLNAEVIYRIPENAEIGYLQLFPAPWDRSRVVLAILGSSSQAVQAASKAFSDPLVQPSLLGNFAILSGAQVIAMDTRLSTGVIKLPVNGEIAKTPGAVEVNVPPGEIASQTGAGTTFIPAGYAGNLPGNSWIFPTLIASSALIVLIILIMIVSALVRRGRRKPVVIKIDEE